MGMVIGTYKPDGFNSQEELDRMRLEACKDKETWEFGGARPHGSYDPEEEWCAPMGKEKSKVILKLKAKALSKKGLAPDSRELGTRVLHSMKWIGGGLSEHEKIAHMVGDESDIIVRMENGRWFVFDIDEEGEMGLTHTFMDDDESVNVIELGMEFDYDEFYYDEYGDAIVPEIDDLMEWLGADLNRSIAIFGSWGVWTRSWHG